MLIIYSNNKEIPLANYKERLEFNTADKIKALSEAVIENPTLLTWSALPANIIPNMLSITNQILIFELVAISTLISFSIDLYNLKLFGTKGNFSAFIGRNQGLKEFNYIKDLCNKVHNKTALILCERGDPKGITNLTRENTNLSSFPFVFSKFEELAKDHNLVFHQVDSIKSMKKTLNSQKLDSIDTLVIDGHGTSKSIRLNAFTKEKILHKNISEISNFFSNSLITVVIKILDFIFKIIKKDIHSYFGFDSNNLNSKDFSCLKKNSNIILLSCSTGNDDDGLSIAKKLSKITNNRKIFAPVSSTNGFTFQNNQPNLTHVNLVSTVSNITAVYQNGKKVE